SGQTEKPDGPAIARLPAFFVLGGDLLRGFAYSAWVPACAGTTALIVLALKPSLPRTRQPMLSL
ncbi:MAG: hypothetical protein ACXW2U_18770, partial [Telluria sp.]